MNDNLKQERQAEFLNTLSYSISNLNFIKLSLGNYHGETKDLKKILIKLVEIKSILKLHFTYRYATKDVVKNYNTAEGMALIKDAIENDFWIATLLTTNQNVTYENIHNKKFKLRYSKSTHEGQINHAHDREKEMIIKSDAPYLNALSITSESGKVTKAGGAKFKQINHFIKLLAPSFHTMTKENQIHVYDMGSGKGYLTFALYDYLKQTRKKPAHVTGLELRKELVEFCNQVSVESKFDHLNFKSGTIQSFVPPNTSVDVMMALHACDTATDDAIAFGIRYEASLIVTAPCCHKQIRREFEKSKKDHNLSPLIDHGIFLERQAEMVTDTIRALLLESNGYKVKVVEFISDAHTPKNVMIIAEKTNSTDKKRQKAKQKINELMQFFGIEEHYLKTLLSNK